MGFLLSGVHWRVLAGCRPMRGSTSCLVIPRTGKEGVSAEPHIDVSVGDYEGRTDCRKPASFAVALYWGIGSSSLNALVKAFERLHMVRAWNSSCTG